MNHGNAYQVGVVFGIEGFQIRNVLEVVGIHFAVFHHIVGNHIVGILGDLQIPAVLGQDILGDLQDLCVGRGGCGYGDGLFTGFAAAACQQAQAQYDGQCDSDGLFHF